MYTIVSIRPRVDLIDVGYSIRRPLERVALVIKMGMILFDLSRSCLIADRNTDLFFGDLNHHNPLIAQDRFQRPVPGQCIQNFSKCRHNSPSIIS